MRDSRLAAHEYGNGAACVRPFLDRVSTWPSSWLDVIGRSSSRWVSPLVTSVGAPAVSTALAHDAVGEETVIEGEQHDVADLNLLDGAPLDEQYITRPDRREHARAGHLDAGGAEAPQGLGDERRGGRRQEDFLTALHGPLVGLILPQASAIVSKTCSRVNAGFSYAFLADSCGGTGSRSESGEVGTAH